MLFLIKLKAFNFEFSFFDISQGTVTFILPIGLDYNTVRRDLNKMAVEDN